MSNPHDDQITDYIQDHPELFREWLDSKDDPIDEVEYLVLGDKKLGPKFNAWATQEAIDRLSAVPDREPDEDYQDIPE